VLVRGYRPTRLTVAAATFHADARRQDYVCSVWRVFASARARQGARESPAQREVLQSEAMSPLNVETSAGTSHRLSQVIASGGKTSHASSDDSKLMSARCVRSPLATSARCFARLATCCPRSSFCIVMTSRRILLMSGQDLLTG